MRKYRSTVYDDYDDRYVVIGTCFVLWLIWNKAKHCELTIIEFTRSIGMAGFLNMSSRERFLIIKRIVSCLPMCRVMRAPHLPVASEMNHWSGDLHFVDIFIRYSNCFTQSSWDGSANTPHG